MPRPPKWKKIFSILDGLLGEYGLSVWIEAAGSNIFFDTGKDQ